MAKAKMTEFQLAYLQGEKSDIRIQKALVAELVAFVDNGYKVDQIQNGIWDFLVNGNNPDGFRAIGIKKWLTTVGGFQLNEAGILERQDREFDGAWLDTAKETMWYKGLALPKDWHDPRESAHSQLAAGLIRGGITWAELAEEYTPKVLAEINGLVCKEKTRKTAVQKAVNVKKLELVVSSEDLAAGYLKVVPTTAMATA